MKNIRNPEWLLLAGAVPMAALFLGLAGCNRTQSQGPDPACANLAPGSQVCPAEQGQPQTQTAATPAQAPETAPTYAQGAYEGAYQEQLSEAPTPPPPLPDYSQPPCPGEGYLWTPGYWAYSPAGYYWVPGAWIMAPWVGALWTPPWWGFSGGHYLWHAGYWGPYVGFYGGINYGFGYTGAGYFGGYWGGGIFHYNRAALNIRTSVAHNVYDRSVVNFTPRNRISYNGPGGIRVQPSASEQVAFRERRMGVLPAQAQLAREAAANRGQFAGNHGRPAIVAAEHPLQTRNERPSEAPGRGAEPMNARPEAREPGRETAPPNFRAQENARPGVHPEAPGPRPSEPNTRPEARQEMRPAPAAPNRAAARPTEPMRPAAPTFRPQPNARPEARQEMRPAPAAPNRAMAPPAAARPEAPHPAPAMRQSAPPPRPAPQARPAAPANPREKRG